MCPENKTELFDQHRREFFGMAAMAIAAAGMGSAALAQDAPGSTTHKPGRSLGGKSAFPPLKQIDAGLLNVGYAEAGPQTAPP